MTMSMLADPNSVASLDRSPEDDTVAQIADLLAEHRLSNRPLESLPPQLRPGTADLIEPVMLALHRRLPWQTAGWKVGAASVEVQRLERLPGPIPGRLYTHRLFATGDSIGRSEFINHRNTECEFAFILDSDLPPRDEPYSAEDLRDAVGAMVPVFEVGDSVFPHWYEASEYFGPCLDNGGGSAMVLGHETYDWRSADLAEATIDLYVNGKHQRQGRGKLAMGHPLQSLAWLATWVSSYGIGLRAGELLSSGTCTSHCFAEPGDEIVADFAEFGEVRVRYLDHDL